MLTLLMNTPTAHRHPHRRLALLLLLTTASFSLLTPAGAQVVAPVPPVINYQGRVTDAAGQPIGGAGATNRKMIFRIWDAATGGTRLWTEEQTVTIAAGEFSVLLGSGINATGTAAGESRPSLEAVFNSITSTPGGTRYLEVMVDEGGGTIDGGDVPISPRQQLTTTAYSFRAKSADSIASGKDLQLNGSSNYGLGYYGTGRIFSGIAIDGPVLYGLSGGALGAVNGATQSTALRWNAAGQVGIGSADLSGADATSKLILQGDDGISPPKQLTIRGNTTTKRLYLGYNTTSNHGALQAYNGASTPTSLMINAAGGNVGIGTGSLAPASMLSVGGQIRIDANSLNDGTNNHNLIFGNVGSGEYIGRRATPGGNQFGLDFFTGNTPRITITNSGNVGIGTQAPGALLEVSGSQGNFRVHPFFPPSNNTIYAASLNSASTAGAQFRFQRTGDFIDIGQNGAGSFVIENSSDTAIMTLTQAAAVGIGVTNPASNTKFHVRDSRTAVGNGEQWLSQSAFSGPNHAVVMGEFDSNGTDAGGQVAVIGGHNAALNIWTPLAINPIVAGRVGIGTANPNASLTIRADAALTPTTRTGTTLTSSGGGHLRLENSHNNHYWALTIHRTNSSFELWHDGTQRGFFTSTGAYSQMSDRRLKTNITPLEPMLDRVMQLTPTSYWFKTAPDAPVRSLGLIAQDVKPWFPEVVSGSGAEGEFLSVNYSALVPVLIKAVQELKEAQDSGAEGLRKENVKLSGLLEQSRSEKEALEKRLSALEAQDKAREARLVAIEKQLLSADKPAARTASLKQGGGAE